MKNLRVDNQHHEGYLLKKWMNDNGMSVIQLADKLLVTRQNIYYNIKQESLPLEFKNRLLISGYDIFGTGLSKNTRASVTNTKLSRNLPLMSDPNTLTNYGIPMLPTDETAFNPDADLPVPVYKLTDPDLTGAEFGIMLRGASMYPKYMPGSRIALRRVKDPDDIIYSHVYFVITTAGIRTVVYIEPDPQGREDWVLLRPHNTDMHATALPRAKLGHIFLVLGSVQYE